jgi:hypothetical protein
MLTRPGHPYLAGGSRLREGFMSDSIKFGGVTLDCPDVGELTRVNS